MQVRPEVNLIVGACTSEVNAMERYRRQICPQHLLSEKPIATLSLPSDICIGRHRGVASSLRHPSLGIGTFDTAGTHGVRQWQKLTSPNANVRAA
jgi:hypothetical protein